MIVFQCRRSIFRTMLFQAADWEPIDSIIQRACWTWLGHVARMHIPALPKLALWGWPSTSKAGSKRRLQGSWLKAVLAKTSLSARDWFRIAVSRGGQWQAAGRRFFPKRKMSKEHSLRLGSWKKGSPLPIPPPKRIRRFDGSYAPNAPRPHFLSGMQGRFGLVCSLRCSLQFFPRNSRQSFGDKAFFSMFSLRSGFSV